MDLGASAEHERRLLRRVREAAAALAVLEGEVARARLARDQAVRAALGGGVPNGNVSRAAGVSPGFVTRIKNAPRA